MPVRPARPRPALHLLAVVASTLAGAAWLWVRGPEPVFRGSTPLDEQVPFLYMLLAFPVLGMLVADAADAFLDRAGWARCVEAVGRVAVLVALGGLRLDAHVPMSGHALIASFVAVHRAVEAPAGTRTTRLELAGAVATLAAVGWIKLAWWDDPLTLGVGLAVGAALAAGFRAVAGRASR